MRGLVAREHLDGGYIHMNGRVFDPKVGRFLSVDPIIQFPDNSQSLNPYSYVLNNPFAGTDPSGFAASLLSSYMQERIAAQQGGCMGDPECQEVSDRLFLMGPTASLRAGLQAGGAPPGKGPKNGKEEQRTKARVMTEAAADTINSVSDRGLVEPLSITGMGGGREVAELTELVRKNNVNVTSIDSKTGESFADFIVRVGDYLRGKTKSTGDEYRTAFGARADPNVPGETIYRAKVYTANSPFASGAPNSFDPGYHRMAIYDQHTHGYLKAGRRISSVDVAFSKASGITMRFQVGDLVKRRFEFSGIDDFSPFDLKLTGGILVTDRNMFFNDNGKKYDITNLNER